MDHRLFLRYNKFADSYKMGQPNIYYFLKDCGFQRIYKSNGNATSKLATSEYVQR